MDRNVNNCTPRHWHTELLTREAGPSGPRPPNRIWGSWRARPEYKNSGPAWTRRLWRPRPGTDRVHRGHSRPGTWVTLDHGRPLPRGQACRGWRLHPWTNANDSSPTTNWTSTRWPSCVRGTT